jgi:Chlorophyll A-B binding protein
LDSRTVNIRSTPSNQTTIQPTTDISSSNIMSKLSLLLSLLVGSAAAFTPAKQAARSSSSLQAFEDEIGAQPPLGYFDPLGLLDGADAERFNRLRYVEIKHGRVCMLAVLGHIVTTGGVRLPGDIDYHGTSFASIPSGLAALSKVPAAGLLQIFLFIGFLELGVMKDITGDGEFVGDFRNDFIDFGWDTFTPEEKERKRAIELNNGRAAQMGILALMVHEQLPTHDPYMINGLIGSPVDFNAGF